MITQDNIWRDMRRISRIIGALLTIVGGITIAFQGYLGKMLPPADGYIRVEAEVVNRDQRGTFRDPAFTVTLAYSAADLWLRSGRRIDFTIYDALSIGDRVVINYNPRDPYEWRLEDVPGSGPDDYMLSLVMVSLGLLSLTFPTIVGLASREDTFQYLEDMNDN